MKRLAARRNCDVGIPAFFTPLGKFNACEERFEADVKRGNGGYKTIQPAYNQAARVHALIRPSFDVCTRGEENLASMARAKDEDLRAVIRFSIRSRPLRWRSDAEPTAGRGRATPTRLPHAVNSFLRSHHDLLVASPKRKCRYLTIRTDRYSWV